jgi:hypothetical protein
MKNILTYFVIFITGLLLFSCDKPAPTELINDVPDELEVEILTKDLDDNYTTSGADTSGITQDITGIANLISVSGIKITHANKTNHISLAQAMFFDKSRPVRYSNQRILAYKTITPGVIRFNGIEARRVPYEIKYWDMKQPKVALLGEKYLLVNYFFGFPDQFFYNYNASVSFEFVPDSGQGNNVSVNISTPPEITGRVILNGSRSNRNIEAALEWNGTGVRRITLIVGVTRNGQQNSIPIYKIKTADDGQLTIPKRFFNGLPLNELDKITITFVRSIENYHNSGVNQLLVSSQSIHSILIDIP